MRETVYVHVLKTRLEDQDQIAQAALAVVEEIDVDHALRPEVFASDDGIRVMVTTRWRCASTPHLLREGSIIQRALLEHPVLARATPCEAHLYRDVRRDGRDAPGGGSER